tara:strand:- start:607 stop:1290 length:684 start_codon:yes stop_codon:yes gene_type:complete
MKKNIFLALDFDNASKALAVTEKVKDNLAGIKIGLELYNKIGLKGIEEFSSFNLPIFLDTKIFDIPNQVAKTIKVITSFKNIKYFTIHALGSLEMLNAAKKSTEGSSLELLAVSILTSWNEQDLKKIGINCPIKDQVEILIKLAAKAQISGVIASPLDIKLARSISKDLKIFCPGIRADNDRQDQKRTLSYKEFNFLADEKCFAVIGRPIYEGDPLENINKIINYSN